MTGFSRLPSAFGQLFDHIVGQILSQERLGLEVGAIQIRPDMHQGEAFDVFLENQPAGGPLPGDDMGNYAHAVVVRGVGIGREKTQRFPAIMGDGTGDDNVRLGQLLIKLVEGNGLAAAGEALKKLGETADDDRNEAAKN